MANQGIDREHSRGYRRGDAVTVISIGAKIWLKRV